MTYPNLARMAAICAFAMTTQVAPASAQISKSQFCSTWNRLCDGRLCPRGPKNCTDNCQSRYKSCLSTGSFYFSTGSRDYSNPQHRQMVTH
jgi:hypothetical protein